MSNVEKLLGRLSGVRKRPDGRWMARCPAHEDSSASLSIRAIPDGRIMIHCFAQCEALDVLGALGLEFSDLFPEKLGDHLPKAGRIAFAADAMRALNHELWMVRVLAADMSRGTASAEACQRAALAAERIQTAMRMCNG